MYRAFFKWILLVSVAVATTSASAITGVWGGQLRSSDGQMDTVMYGFTAAGNPVFPIATRDGVHEVEVRYAGQTHQWRTSDGIASGRVDALSVTPSRVQAVLSINTESMGSSMMEQREERLALDFVQSGNAVHLTVVTESMGHMSGGGLFVEGKKHRKMWRGTLQRLR